jgi:preprotein translocase SecE subunit
MSVARYVNLSFVAIGLISYVVLSEFIAWFIEMFGGTGANMALLGVNFRMANLIAMVVSIGFAIGLKRSERVSTYAMEVGNELSKVTWPTWKETRLSTVVVIVVTLIIAAILGLLDLAWGALSNLVYE